MDKLLRILLVEDSIDDVTLIEHFLKKEGLSFSSRTVETKEEYKKQLMEFQPDVVISDHSLPQFNSMEALELYLEFKKEYKHPTAFVLVTGTVSEEFAVNSIHSGADDYILKDRLKRLPTAIIGALEKNRLKEQRKREEEEKLHLLKILQKSLHKIFVLDPETLKFEYVNEEGLRNLGYTSQEMSEMTVGQVIHEFKEKKFRKIIAKVQKNQKGKIFERYAVRKNKTRYPVQIHMESIQQGSKKLLLANVLDITETKEHEQQRKLAFFIQNCFGENRSLQNSLKLVLKELCRLSSIPAAEVWTTGFDRDKIERYSLWNEQGLPTPTVGEFFAKQAYTTGKIQKCESLQHQSFLIDGALQEEGTFAGTVAYPIRLGKEVVAVIVVFTQEIIKERDPFISLREGVQDKLASNIKRKKTEEELRKIFEFSPDILCIIGKDGYVKKINPALQKILGYSNEEILSTPFAEFIHPNDMHTLEDLKQREMVDNETAQYENRYITADGDYRWFAWSVTPFLNEGLLFAVGKDITEFKKQVVAIQEQNKRLAEIAWEQSHIVRAPLARLMACLAYLEEEQQENHSEMMESIKNSAHELDGIIQRIVKKTEKLTGDAGH